MGVINRPINRVRMPLFFGSSADKAWKVKKYRRQNSDTFESPVEEIRSCPPTKEADNASEEFTGNLRRLPHRRVRSEPVIASPSKVVGFSNLEIRTYNVTIGDHPCCTAGCPITLDWEYSDSSVLPVDLYEASRSPRRHKDELRTTSEQRMEILSQDGGPSEEELRRAQRKLFRIRSCDVKLCEKASESFFQEG